MLRALMVGLVIVMGVTVVGDMVFDHIQKAHEAAMQLEIDRMNMLELALIDTEDGAQSYLKTGRRDYLERFLTGARGLSRKDQSLDGLDRFASTSAEQQKEPWLPSTDLSAVRAAWEAAVSMGPQGQQATAGASPQLERVEEMTRRLRDTITEYLHELAERSEALAHRDDLEGAAFQTWSAICAVLIIIVMIYAFRNILGAIRTGVTAKQQVEQLFAMAEMLQSATGHDDTNEILHATAARLLPGYSGTLYVFNNSRDRLDRSTCWGSLGQESPDHIGPTACWALKRGKVHLNQTDVGALRCGHAKQGLAILEIPMAARGQLYGLLEIIAEGPDAGERLSRVKPVASAMGDAMSLALSSIALREQLRNQALRDPLTGLYNRRFLEEMLERMCRDAERRKAPLSAIMIDLDHFKMLNDQHGHAAGDAALREVAAAILSCLRSIDVACRYGGEELAVLLSDSSLEAAMGKAEQIRARIAELTRASGIAVTASFGVASIPETNSQAADLLNSADHALYQAKQQGRDRVVAARPRASAQRLSLVDGEAAATPAE